MQEDFQQRVQRTRRPGRSTLTISAIQPANRCARTGSVADGTAWHRTGERMMEIVSEAGEPGERIINNLGRDELVSSLPILHMPPS